MTACLACGVELVQPARGRRRRFCSDACREQAYRERLAVTKCEGDPDVPPTPRVASKSFPRAFWSLRELDAWLGIEEREAGTTYFHRVEIKPTEERPR